LKELKSSKRSATVTTFVLIIGMLFISVAAIGVLRNLALKQSKTIEYDYTVSVVEKLKSVIDKANSYPDDAEFTIKLKNPLIYRAEVNNNKIVFYFPKLNVKREMYFFSPNINIVPSSFETSGVIQVYKKNNNLYITPKLKCNLSDDKCDPGCIVLGLCDKACYKENVYDVCNPYCLDRNHDGKINRYDSDNVCDPDCYNNFKNKFYDVDCLDDNDGICDPDTNNIKDGFCDRDCLGTNGVCDPDCDVYDADCPHKGNGICEPLRGENCENDANCSCSSKGKICKASCGPFIADKKTDEWGCVDKNMIKNEGEPCSADCECNTSLICDSRFKTYHCCPENSYYNESIGCVNYKEDGKCITEEPFSENCENSIKDCNCKTLHLGDCCVDCVGALENGCCDAGYVACNGKCLKIDKKLKEGESCECDAQCGKSDSGKDMECSTNPDDKGDKACCPEGKVWMGKDEGCVNKKKFKIVIVPVDYHNMNEFRERAETIKKKFEEESPFREPECKGVLEIQIIDKNFDCKIMDPKGSYCLYNGMRVGIPTATVNFVEEQGITDFNIVAALSDVNIANGYSTPPFPFTIVFGGIPKELDDYATNHEIGHQFKLCDEYGYKYYREQGAVFQRFPALGLEKPPYNSCGNEYPLHTGIGPTAQIAGWDGCKVDCSVDSSACKIGTCGKKMSDSYKYVTSVMGGGGAMVVKGGVAVGLVAYPKHYTKESYDYMLKVLKDGGYCG